MNAAAAAAEILLVEDDRATARLVEVALKGSTVALHMSVAQDGEQALAMLRRQGAYAQAPRPDLILLDLNLPRKDGFAVLGEVKMDPTLKRIPVAILTTSPAPADIQRSYDLGANCYLVKPHDLLQMRTVMRSTVDFWLATVALPNA